MGKEQDFFDYLFKQDLEQYRGNPQKILDLMFEYPEAFMVIGIKKGAYIVKKLQEIKPKVMVELGAYIGYSALLFGAELKKFHGKYYSYEVNPEYAAMTQKVVDLAGLSDTVEVVVGPAAKAFEDFAEKSARGEIPYRNYDVIFVDHWKDLYVPDTRVLESLNLIAPGTVLFGDNILAPGAPEYKFYMSATPQERREYNFEHDNVNGKKYIGRWNILYKTEFEHFKSDSGWEDEVAYSRCIEYLDA